MLICNKCGKTMRRGKFCVECGSELSEFFTVKTNAENTQEIECPSCGKRSAQGSFCIYCATPLKKNTAASAASQTEPAKPVSQPTEVPAQSAVSNTSPVQDNTVKLQCVECGKIHDKGKFCTSCGGALKPVGSAPAQTAAPVQTAPSPAPIPAPAPAPVQNNGTKLQCVECGMILDKGKFCTSCGGALKPMEIAPAQTAAPAPTPIPMPSSTPQPTNIPQQTQPLDNSAAAKANGLVCPTCGKSFEKGKFCTVCGTTLVPAETAAPAGEQPLHCVSCGKTFQAGKFCTACGGQLVR